ncbi:cyclic peptide export ABC transporter [Paenibacillus pabuli]|uniref:cyclic peptide export ABC transporter n=1 Tax=Paenibacillus pabuli TaxID=1472 RepID=UPI003CF5B3CE
MKNLTVVLLLLFLIFSQAIIAYADSGHEMEESILKYTKDILQKNDIPGAYIAIIDNNRKVVGEGYGFADKSDDVRVNEKTFFELGSNSKAFTALAILELESKGKINLDSEVSQYLPWFYTLYEGEKASITVKQLLHHTSGIPFKTIGQIQEDNDSDALERTVRRIIGTKLDNEPGDKFLYATINYDVLGLIIEKVTGISFEEYLKKNIFEPLGLHDTYFYSQLPEGTKIATGYKKGFFGNVEYSAPEYRGNSPAGYVISNGRDMTRWLRIQIGLEDDIPEAFKEWVRNSHDADRTVAPSLGGTSYAFGWNTYQVIGGEISHSGENPTFSSYIGLLPGNNSGVVVLSNINSAYTTNVGENILNLLRGKEIHKLQYDMYTRIDQLASSGIVVFGLLCLFLVYKIFSIIVELFKKRRRFQYISINTWMGIILVILFSSVLSIGLYLLPHVLFNELPWSFVLVWGPLTIMVAALTILAAIWLYTAMYILYLIFPKIDENTKFTVVLISLLSGFGNAFIIFTINIALFRNEFSAVLLFYFGIGLMLYVFGQKFLRTKLIRMTNDSLFLKRKEITQMILNSRYQKIESFGREKIYPVLNNDTETISGSINVVISGITSLVTLICCLIYLGFINLYGLFISLIIIVVTAGFYYFIATRANQVWEQTRDIQNSFFKIIAQLLEGFKELSLHKKKRDSFQEDAEKVYDSYRIKRAQGDVAFANVFVIGELLFTLVIGCSAFLFPVIFPELENESIRNYVFVFLYMTGPVNGILNAVPQFTRIKISMNRINELLQEMKELKAESQVLPINRSVQEIRLDKVTYHYRNNDDDSRFGVGPLSCTFRAGETTFITGGNGSGKSTLGKLLTGLYEPADGKILINGEAVNYRVVGEFFSTVYSDFYLFERLYGIRTQGREEEIEKYLSIMQLQDKVRVTEDGRLSNINLSTGQRKRLALLSVYLDDRPICFFDEWAADQDPEFRQCFYNRLLPEMKASGKCIIAVTHDDAYFSVADQVIKLELGKIVRV